MYRRLRDPVPRSGVAAQPSLSQPPNRLSITSTAPPSRKAHPLTRNSPPAIPIA